jgi:hypothetical protein
MRKGSALALLTAGAALTMSLAAAPAAMASGGPGPGGGSGSGGSGSGGSGGGDGGGRPCGRAVSTSGPGSLGTGWTLKSMHDDNAAGMPVVGEEFEIGTPAGQVWQITFADNGTVFFSGTVTAPAGGIVVNAMTADQGGTQIMSAQATDAATGETISGSVPLPPAPGTCHTG